MWDPQLTSCFPLISQKVRVVRLVTLVGVFRMVKVVRVVTDVNCAKV